MHKIFSLRIDRAFALFAFLDVVCMGMGMGVPIFCILLGLPVGYYIAGRIGVQSLDSRQMLGKTLAGAALTSAFTWVGMAVLWGPCVIKLFDPNADLANFGIPLILYQPRASFVGWLVLMIFISPFLQLLMTLFASHLTLLWRLPKNRVE